LRRTVNGPVAKHHHPVEIQHNKLIPIDQRRHLARPPFPRHHANRAPPAGRTAFVTTNSAGTTVVPSE
jgi:hypothetical protein